MKESDSLLFLFTMTYLSIKKYQIRPRSLYNQLFKIRSEMQWKLIEELSLVLIQCIGGFRELVRLASSSTIAIYPYF